MPGLIRELEYYVEAVLTPEQAEELSKLYSTQVNPFNLLVARANLCLEESHLQSNAPLFSAMQH